MGRHQDSFGYTPVNVRGSENPCFECGVMTLGIHHVVPVSLGGTKVIPLCEGCHNKVHGGVINRRLIREGLRKARSRNIKLGAPIKTSPAMKDECLSLRKSGMTFKDIASRMKVSVGTVHKLVNCNVGSNCNEGQ